MTKSLIVLLLLMLSSCAPSGPDPGYAAASLPPAKEAPLLPPNACTRPIPAPQCGKGTPGTPLAPALFSSPALGMAPPPSPSLVPVGAPAAPPQPSLPALGSPVFGPTGVVGTVVNHAGSNAIVAPVGGGAPGIYVPNGNGTATIFQPGGVPTVVAAPVP
ncbi:MAG TPA: hypothetical protein VMA86_07460 [Acetobacteraceae bacterium]|nr:hypothetical protein [Acetobacteraceae bacterium]